MSDFLQSLGDDVQERRQKRSVAFKKRGKRGNFANIAVRKQQKTILISIHVDLDTVKPIEGFSRDISGIGYSGTGNFELAISSDADLERAKPLIQQSYEAS